MLSIVHGVRSRLAIRWLVAAGIALLAAVAGAPAAVGSAAQGRDQGRVYDAIRAGGEWFLNHQDSSFLYYTYSPRRDSHPSGHHSLREMGALWSITQLRSFLGDERFYELAQRGFAHFERTFTRDDSGGFTYVNITPREIKLGYSAFAILTLIEIEHPRKSALLADLAQGIVAQQRENGDLDTFFYSDRATGEDYYPGEALLALMGLYEYTGTPRYLEPVGKALPFYRAYWAANPNSAFPPWQSQAYTRYFAATGDPNAREFVYAMSDYQLNRFRDRQGCRDLDPAAGSVLAVYAEGLASAYELARNQGDSGRATCYATYVREATGIVMRLQCLQACLDATGYGPRALGGFFGSPTNHTMRVDRNQHGVLALMHAYRLGLTP